MTRLRCLIGTGVMRGDMTRCIWCPWGEYVPFKAFFGFAKKLTAGVGDMDPGHARNVFRTDGHTYGVFVCYESIFGDEVREFVKNGAEVLVNISGRWVVWRYGGAVAASGYGSDAGD